MKKKIIPVLFVLILLGIISYTFVLPLVKKYTPGKERQDLSEYYNLSSADETAIILNNEIQETKGYLINNTVYIPYSFVNEHLNTRIYWDSNEEKLLYAKDNELLTYSPDEKTASYDTAVVSMVNGEAVVNLDFIKTYSDLTAECYEDPSRVVITNSWTEIEQTNVKKDTEIRVLGGIKSPILDTVTPSENLTVLLRDTKWTKVVTPDGIIGFVRSSKLSRSTTITLESTYVEEEHQHLMMDDEICMLWHQVTSLSGNKKIASYLDKLSGVNVLSPTWFCLSGEDGTITNYASADYVETCHEKGIQVWPTLNDVDFTDVNIDNVLTRTSVRSHLISEVIIAAKDCGCDGINLDFERPSENGSGNSYIEFVRELSIACAQNNLVLSIDDTKPYSFNEFYDRKEQAYFADYIVVMAYDEHYQGGEEGSVSSLPWAEDAAADTIDAGVPANQLILGNPFYTRLWSVSSNGTDITSTVYSMAKTDALLASKNVSASLDSESGQNYAEWVEDTTTYKIWLEDETSVKSRMEIMNLYQLAGVSFWKLGLEDSSIWSVISPYLD